MKQPEIRELPPKKLVGIKITNTLANNQVRSLWKSFMPRRDEVVNRAGKDLYSVQQYHKDFSMEQFNPDTEFTQWAAVQVDDWPHIPEGMDKLLLTGGVYAVFLHKGPASRYPETHKYIYGAWLPGSKYSLDFRPHFEILSEGYLGPDHPDSEEEVWIPVIEHHSPAK